MSLDMNGRFCVYSFRTLVIDFAIKAHFLNSERFRKSGADHSMPSSMRQDWAINLVHHYNDHIDRCNFQVFRTSIFSINRLVALKSKLFILDMVRSPSTRVHSSAGQ